jgi:hypothetical protein
MMAVVGISNAKPENLLFSSPAPKLSHRRNPRANMTMPSTPPTMDSKRSRSVVGETSLSERVVAMCVLPRSWAASVDTDGRCSPSRAI